MVFEALATSLDGKVLTERSMLRMIALILTN